VKIKITEYLPGATREDIATHLSQQPKNDGVSAEHLLSTIQATIARNGDWRNNNALLGGNFIQTNVRFYTIQRVNGTGPNGKEEGSGGHRHSLEESDRIKKNSVVRWMQKNDKGEKAPSVKKKPPVRYSFPSLNNNHESARGRARATWDDAGLHQDAHRHCITTQIARYRYCLLCLMNSLSRSKTFSVLLTQNFKFNTPAQAKERLVFSFSHLRVTKAWYSSANMTSTNQDVQKEKKSYHTKATGLALTTVKKHSKDNTLKLYGSCFWYDISSFALRLRR
jgi:hypothetical protein